MSSSVAAQITVYINDEARLFSASSTLLDALQELGLADRKGVAIAIDDSVVPRIHWRQRRLASGERVLVIQATQGG